MRDITQTLSVMQIDETLGQVSLSHKTERSPRDTGILIIKDSTFMLWISNEPLIHALATNLATPLSPRRRDNGANPATNSP